MCIYAYIYSYIYMYVSNMIPAAGRTPASAAAPALTRLATVALVIEVTGRQSRCTTLQRSQMAVCTYAYIHTYMYIYIYREAR